MAISKAPQLMEVSRLALSAGKLELFIKVNEVNKVLKKTPVEVNDTFDIVIKDKMGSQVENISGIVYTRSSFPKVTSTTIDDLPSDVYVVSLTLNRNKSGSKPPIVDFDDFELFVPDPQEVPQSVSLQPTKFDDTPDEDLWDIIKNTNISFKTLIAVVEGVRNNLDPAKDMIKSGFDRNAAKSRLPFVNVDEYALIVFTIDALMRRELRVNNAGSYFNNTNIINALPYFKNISDPIEDVLEEYAPRYQEVIDNTTRGKARKMKKTSFAKAQKSFTFPAIELIWSYWMEQAMLVQTMNAVSLRFQNVKGLQEIEPLARFDTSPLRTVSTLLWGFIQDEQHRTTLHRRVHEYLHAYNLTLVGKAVPQLRGVDNRSNFLEAFHNLLHYASIFFKDRDDMTRRADGFPLLTALREVHLLLAEGNHNAYYNMTWTTRVEMLTMQYILSKSEMQTFLGGRPMVPYPELWMDRVDTVKNLQGWDSTSILHYFDLATSGEKLLLSIRYGDWANTAFNATDASNWADAFRDYVMKYVNAYRIVTSVDLSVDAIRVRPEDRALQPANLIQRRLQAAAEPMAVPQMQLRMPTRRY